MKVPSIGYVGFFEDGELYIRGQQVVSSQPTTAIAEDLGCQVFADPACSNNAVLLRHGISAASVHVNQDLGEATIT